MKEGNNIKIHQDQFFDDGYIWEGGFNSEW